MLSLLMAILGGPWGHRRDGGSAVCRQSMPWGIVRETVSGIFVGNKRKKEEGRKRTLLDDVVSTVDLFPYPPFCDMGDADLEGLLFPTLPAVGCGGGAPWIVSRRGFTCRMK